MQNAVGVGARRASFCRCAVNRTARRRSGGAWAWRRRCRTRRASVRVSRRALARRDYPAARLSARRTTRYHCWKGRGECAHRQEEQVSLSKYRAERHADRLKRRAARAASRADWGSPRSVSSTARPRSSTAPSGRAVNRTAEERCAPCGNDHSVWRALRHGDAGQIRHGKRDLKRPLHGARRAGSAMEGVFRVASTSNC